MRRLALTLVALGTLLAALGLGLGAQAVSALRAEEHVSRSEARPLRAVGHVLARAPLAPGRSLLLELCAEDAFGATAWDAARFDVVFAHADGEPETALTVPGVEAREAVRRAPDGSGCTTLARAEALPVMGEARLVLHGAPEPLLELRVLSQATTWRPLGDAAPRAGGLLGLGVLLVLAGAWLRRARDELRPTTVRRAVLGAGLFLGLLAVLELVPSLGGADVAQRGSLLIAAQVALALALGPRSLALHAPGTRAGAWFGLALVTGLALIVAGRVVAGLFPSTGVAAVETLVALPSGSVAFGLYALVAPLAEELFFRGFLYGAFERRFGANAATGLVVALFALVHLAQTAGAWGAFASVALTGLVLTLLRRLSGSTLVPALAHVAHNAWLTLGALA